MTISVNKTGAFFAASFAALSPAVWAQNHDDRGGLSYRLDLAQRFESNTNPTLSEDPKGTVYFSNTRLAFNLHSETRTQTFDLDVSGALRLSQGPESDGVEVGAVDPRIALSYSQIAAASRIDLMASLMRTQINNANPVLGFTDATGQAEIVPDFADLSGTGTRDALAFGAKLSVWDDAPFGLAFSANAQDLSYNNTTNPDLTESTRARVEVEGRFDITPVMQATAALHYTSLDNSVVARSRTGADFGLTIDQPDGSYGGHARVVDGDAGVQASLTFAREIIRPNSRFTFGLGASRATTEDIFATGYLVASHELADTRFEARAERRLDVDNDDTEDMLTTLSLGARIDVSDYGTLAVDVGYGDSLTLATDDRTTLSSIGVTYTHDLSEDWSVDASATYTQRAVTGAADANSTSIALTINRSFDFR